MKILCILNDLDIGGAQSYTINLINGFYDKGIDVRLMVLSNNIPIAWDIGVMRQAEP